MSRNREQYWLQQYLEKLSGISPRPVLDCIVTGFHSTVYDYSPFRLKDSNDSDRSVDEYESNYQDSNEVSGRRYCQRLIIRMEHIATWSISLTHPMIASPCNTIEAWLYRFPNLALLGDIALD